MKARLVTLTLVAFAMWAIKRHYADARAEDLDWILGPTARLVSAFSGASFEWIPGEGYLCRERLFLIEKPCAGVNFLLAAFATVAYVLSRRARAIALAAPIMAVSLAAAYGAALLVNTARISLALGMATHPGGAGLVTAAQMHRIEGIVVYFGGLLLVYELARRMVEPNHRRWRPWVPLASYLGITLGVPLANGALGLGRVFFEHASFVLLVPGALLALAWSANRIFYRLQPSGARAQLLVDGAQT